MRWTIICVLIFLCGMAMSANAGTVKTCPAEAVNCYPVDRVIDGDTIVVNILGQPHPVRLIGINAPETKHPNKDKQCYGEEATRTLSTWLKPGAPVVLVNDGPRVDRHGRLRRYVLIYLPTLPGVPNQLISMNELLISFGAAIADKHFNYRNKDAHLAAERWARNKLLGMWGQCRGEEA